MSSTDKKTSESLEKIDNTLTDTHKIYYSVLDKHLHENIFRPLNEVLAQRQQANIINRYNNAFLNESGANTYNTSEFHGSLDDLNVTLNNLKTYLISKEKLTKEQRSLEIIESRKHTATANTATAMPENNIIDSDIMLTGSKPITGNVNDPFNLETNMSSLNSFGLDPITTAPNTSTMNTNNNQQLADFGLDLSMFGLENNIPPAATETTSANAASNPIVSANTASSANKGEPDLMTDINLNEFNLDNFDLNLDLGGNNNGAGTNNSAGNNSATNPNFEFNFDWE